MLCCLLLCSVIREERRQWGGSVFDRTNEGLFILKRSSWVPDKEPMNGCHVDIYNWRQIHVRLGMGVLGFRGTIRLTGQEPDWTGRVNQSGSRVWVLVNEDGVYAVGTVRESKKVEICEMNNDKRDFTMWSTALLSCDTCCDIK